jgi:hypothetical protein
LNLDKKTLCALVSFCIDQKAAGSGVFPRRLPNQMGGNSVSSVRECTYDEHIECHKFDEAEINQYFAKTLALLPEK